MGDSPQTIAVAELESEDEAKCVSLDFYDILGLDLCFDYTPGANWKIRCWGTIKLLGNPVAGVETTFDVNHAAFTLPVNVWLAKADITIGIKDLKLCPYVGGDACYWNFPASKWSCAKFEKTLFCFLP